MRICYLGDSKSIHTKKFCYSFAKLGHDIHLITFSDVEIEGIRTYCINAGKVSVRGGNYNVLSKVKKIRKLIHQIEPDILHALYATSYGYIGSRAKFHPYIITAQGTDVLISPWQSKIIKYFVSYALKKADIVTVVADHMQNAVRRLNIHSDKIRTTMLGVDTELFNSNGRKVDNEHFIIVSSRNFEPVYNIHVLIDAIDQVIKVFPDIRLILAGNGSLINDLKKQVTEKHLDSIISFVGKLSQEKLANLLKSCHLYITLSGSDGNSIALNEAIACGNVLIVSDIPANLPWIMDGQNGFKVPCNNPRTLAEKIIEIKNNYSKFKDNALENNCRLIHEKADWNENVKKIENLYLSLIK